MAGNGFYMPKRRHSDGSLMEQYEEQSSVSRRANREVQRAQMIAALRNQRLELISRGVSPRFLPDVTDVMSEADLGAAQRRMQGYAGQSAQNVNRSRGLAAPGTIIQRDQDGAQSASTLPPPNETAAQMEARTEAGTAAALAAQGPNGSSEPQQTGALSQASGEPALATAIRKYRPDLANADIQITPTGPQVMMQSQTGPRLVAFQPTTDMVMDAHTGGQWSTMTPEQRAQTYKQAMPTAPQNFVSETGPQSVYSDELGRDRGAMDGILGSTKMGIGTRNPDGSFDSITGGAGITEVTGGRTTNVVDASGNIVGREAIGKYGKGSSTFAPVAPLDQVAAAPSNVDVKRPGQPQLPPPAPGALDFIGPVAPAKAPTPAATPESPDFVGPLTPSQQLNQARSAAAASDAQSAAQTSALKSKIQKRAADSDTMQEVKGVEVDAETRRKREELERRQIEDPTHRMFKGMMGSNSTPLDGAVYAGLGQDNKGTGNARSVAPTPLGLTSTTNDVVDHFARNPEEDQMRKRLSFSGFGSYA